MAEPMMADIPAAPTAPPKQEQFDKVIDAQANTAEASLDALAPIGDFSVPRLAALARGLDSVVKLFGAKIPPTEIPAQIKGGKLPIDMLLRIAAIKAAVDTWHETEEGMEIDIPEIKDLNSDAALAMLTVSLGKIASDKSFKAFLKAPPKPLAPEGVEEKGAGDMEGEKEDMSMSNMSPSASADINTVFPK